MISITKLAVTKLVKIANKNNVNKFLFSVKGGGCNGFKYNISPMNEEPQKLDEVINIKDELNLIIDHKSVFYIIGTEIDWKEDIMGSSFEFNNPNATSKCGCGETFSINWLSLQNYNFKHIFTNDKKYVYFFFLLVLRLFLLLRFFFFLVLFLVLFFLFLRVFLRLRVFLPPSNSEKLSFLAAEKILDNIDNILEDKAKFIEQDHSKATYAKKIDKKEGQINWNSRAKEIIGKINGLTPNPGVYFSFKGERYKILKAKLGNGIGKSGEVISNDLEIACVNNESIKIIQIQRQGKKSQKISEFILGSQIKKGSIISDV